MTGRIEIYLDIVSFYSYVAFKQLLDTRSLLEAHGVQVDIKPFFLGGIMAASGNRPPWTVPAKAKYGSLDADRTQHAVGLPDISPPEDLMAVSRTMLPLRALHYIKATYSLEAYLTTWHYFLHLFWGPPKRNLCEAAELAKALAEVRSGFGGASEKQSSQPLFSNHDVENILKATGEAKWKAELKTTVEEALERGAFGAPWLWVTNDQGKSEPFFGTDRWHFVYEFLGLPYQKSYLLGPDGKAKL
ncbi:thioredoxin-like protein [Truncatella angustata]|uniref:Glutathione S-transferase kappa n=1 Tax=Truncatella angustata TaxID=152316 RepID=A0A9P8ZXI2_9PEZI|nr:thioredoxin-like protein [Truncatella angustata]KAH6654019.1 thioredoxin-like protein [Truncatella angustata]